DRALINSQVAAARRWQTLAEPTLAQVAAGEKPTIAGMQARKRVMDGFRRTNTAFMDNKNGDRGRDRSRAQSVSVAIIGAIGGLFLLIGWLAFERPARRTAQSRRRMAEFGDALQVARSEREAFDVLKRHLER